MYDIGYQFSMNTQQLMEQPLWVNTVGDWQQTLMNEYGIDPSTNPTGVGANTNRMKVTPEQLMVDINLNVKDGSVMSSDNPQTWNQLFQTIVSQPALFQNLDVVRIFKHIARMNGAKDINEFVIKAGAIPQITPQDQGQIEQQAQNGNLVALPNGGR
jgi:hypothetical protein